MALGPVDLLSIFFCLVLGLCLGSFASALIYRIPRGLSWISDRSAPSRSACIVCGHTLHALDLVPLLSWLILRGRCRYCKNPVSSFYPLLEIITMALTLGLFWAWDLSWWALPLLLAVPFMVAAVVIDWQHMILPDDTNIALTVLAAIHVAILSWQAGWDWTIAANHILAGLALFLFLWGAAFSISKWKRRDALGMGDLKLLPAAGLFLGISAIPSYLVAAGLLGLATAALRSKRGQTGTFPFGPALVISLYLHVFLTGLGFDYTW